eukprot:gnl/Hemi2/25239_TR8491_c0_g1_i2.p1 gnl/Hemi2/25239_TR8491_c0_g1~~gnl/Hemi2/25239_TR8491_c0_g1_i2.p1  ORF type:complete len:487 (-),score=121.39 gnl/Hemi2/25239_TR8491_c0_g1_i2:60-1520(-)
MQSMQALHAKYLADFESYQNSTKHELSAHVQSTREELQRLGALQENEVARVVHEVDSALQSATQRYVNGVRKLDADHSTILSTTAVEKQEALKELRKLGRAQVQQLAQSQRVAESEKGKLFQESLDTLCALREQKALAIGELRSNTTQLVELSVGVDHSARGIDSLAQYVDDQKAHDLRQLEKVLEQRELACQKREEQMAAQEQQATRVHQKLTTLYAELQASLDQGSQSAAQAQQKLLTHLQEMRLLQEAIQEERVNALQEIGKAQASLHLSRQTHIRERETFIAESTQERKALASERQNLLLQQQQLTVKEQERTRKLTDAESIVRSEKLRAKREKDGLEELRQQLAMDKQAYSDTTRRFEAERQAFGLEAKKLTDLGQQVQHKTEEAHKQMARIAARKAELMETHARLSEVHMLSIAEAQKAREVASQLQYNKAVINKSLTELAAERQELQKARTFATQTLTTSSFDPTQAQRSLHLQSLNFV